MDNVAIVAPLAVLGGLVIGVLAGFWGRRVVSANRVGEAETESQRLVDVAKEESRGIVVEAREEALKLRSEGETEIRER